jgi:hypothetical protein
MYSRDVSRYYEQDALLRHFPVPRTEIDELQVDLKFAIAGIEINPAQSVGREASAASIFIDFSYDLTELFFETLGDVLPEQKPKDAEVASESWRNINSMEQRIYLRQDLLKFFQRNQGRLIRDGEFQVAVAHQEIEGLLSRRARWMVKESEFSTRALKKITGALLREVRLEDRMKELSEPLKFAWEQGGDFTLDVEVTADKLQDLGAEHLSTIQVRTRLRNYIWSEVEHEGRRWWSLNPE